MKRTTIISFALVIIAIASMMAGCKNTGVKFTTGLVLIYDDMPELSAPITIDENGLFTIHDIVIRSRF